MNTIYLICLALLVSVQLGIVNGSRKTDHEEPEVGATVTMKDKETETKKKTEASITVKDPENGPVTVEFSNIRPQDPWMNTGEKVKAKVKANVNTENGRMCAKVKASTKTNEDEALICKTVKAKFGFDHHAPLKPGEERTSSCEVGRVDVTDPDGNTKVIMSTQVNDAAKSEFSKIVCNHDPEDNGKTEVSVFHTNTDEGIRTVNHHSIHGHVSGPVKYRHTQGKSGHPTRHDSDDDASSTSSGSGSISSSAIHHAILGGIAEALREHQHGGVHIGPDGKPCGGHASETPCTIM